MEKNKTGSSREYMIHPGETLHELLEDRGMSQNQLAIRTGFSSKQISEVINGKASITAKLAKALEDVFAAPAQYWLNLQNNYSLELERISNQASAAEFEVLKSLKEILAYLRTLGLIESGLKKEDQVIALRRFLSVSNLTAIPSLEFNAAFRRQGNIAVNPNVFCTWLKICEIQAEKAVSVGAVDLERLRKELPLIKSLMHIEINKARTELKRIFAQCGIKFGVVRHFTGAPVYGFIEKNKSGELILFLTIRGSYADRFWFTLFHEIAHILNGDIDGQTRFIDYDFSDNAQERLANEYAGNMLVAAKDYISFVKTGDFSYPSIESFSEAQGVITGIVIGRLQWDKHIPHSWYNQYKKRYSWKE